MNKAFTFNKDKLNSHVRKIINVIKLFFRKHYKKILIVFGIVILVAIFTISVSFAIIKQSGKKSLFASEKTVVQGCTTDNKDISGTVQFKGKTYKYKEDCINILCLGIDKNDGVEFDATPGDMGQSDAIYLVSIDTKNDDVRILAIPRDSMVPVQMFDSDNIYKNMKTMQITLQYAYGNNSKKSAELSAKAVSALLYNIPIHRVCAVNVNLISLVNDSIGGVQVTINNDFTDESEAVIDEEFVKGNVVTLHGDQARAFVQERDCSLFASSMDRIERQNQYIDSFTGTLQKAFQKNRALPLNVYDKVKKSGYVATDISFSESIYLLSKLSNLSVSQDKIITVPGEVIKGEEYEEYNVDYKDLRGIVMSAFYEQVNN